MSLLLITFVLLIFSTPFIAIGLVYLVELFEEKCLGIKNKRTSHKQRSAK